MQEAKRIPTMSTRLDLPCDLWEEIDRISRLEGITKVQMVRDGLRMWLDQRDGEKADDKTA